MGKKDGDESKERRWTRVREWPIQLRGDNTRRISLQIEKWPKFNIWYIGSSILSNGIFFSRLFHLREIICLSHLILSGRDSKSKQRTLHLKSGYYSYSWAWQELIARAQKIEPLFLPHSFWGNFIKYAPSLSNLKKIAPFKSF